MMNVTRAAILISSTVSLLAVTACSAPTINGFTLTVAPVSISVPEGGSALLTVAATASGSSPVTAAVVLYNLPSNVTISPASPTVTTGSQTVITLSASEGVPNVTNQVQVSGYAGLAYSGAVISVSTVQPQ